MPCYLRVGKGGFDGMALNGRPVSALASCSHRAVIGTERMGGDQNRPSGPTEKGVALCMGCISQAPTDKVAGKADQCQGSDRQTPGGDLVQTTVPISP
jgi:hypothetical protein